MSRGRFRNSRFHHPHAPSSTWIACKFHWFSLRFKHIEKFEAISKHRPLTGQGLEALFENSPKNFYVFLAWFYWCFVNCEQRRWGRAIIFAKFRTSNGTAYVLQLLTPLVDFVNGTGATSNILRCTKKRGALLNRVRTSRMINGREWRGDFFFVKTAADVRHQSLDDTFSPQTYDKKKNGFLEVIFFEQKKSSDYITFTDVFEFSSNLKIMILLNILIPKMNGCMHLWNTWDISEKEQKKE